jgi:hypothetical protein
VDDDRSGRREAAGTAGGHRIKRAPRPPKVKMLRLSANTLISLQTFPIWLLVRKVDDSGPHWEFFGACMSVKDAETVHRQQIQGRGITAWSWWGPIDEALKMLADPHYESRLDEPAEGWNSDDDRETIEPADYRYYEPNSLGR